MKELSESLTVVEEKDEISLLDALIALKLASSKREAREFVSAGAVKVNGVKVNDLNATLSAKNALEGGYIFVKRGKRLYAALKY